MKETKPIEAGDVVVLKSGGPKMTVMSNHFGTVTAAWFDEFRQLQKVDNIPSTSFTHFI